MLDEIREILSRFPGKEKFGPYRFLPFFFLGGAALEYTMIHFYFGEVNFYKTFTKRQVHETAVDYLTALGEL